MVQPRRGGFQQPRRPLLTSQRNDVFTMIQSRGLDPALFEWSQEETAYPPETLVDVIRYRNTAWFCAFGYQDAGVIPMDPTRVTIMSPGSSEVIQAFATYNWNEQTRSVGLWLTNLLRESQPSLWEAIPETAVLADVASGDFGTDPLRPEQVEWVRQRVVLVRQFVLATGPDSATLTRIEAKLDHLEEASKRLSVKDFVNTCLGVLMTIAAEAAMNSDQAKHLFDLMFGGARHLLGF